MGYSDFIDFKQTYDLESDENVINSKRWNNYDPKNYDELYLLETFLNTRYGDDNDQTKYYDLEFRIMHDFPEEFLLKLVQLNFEGRNICYKTLVHIEIVKLLYHVWGKDSIYSETINKIEEHLIETVNMDPEEYYDILYNKSNPRYDRDRNYVYYSWWLYCYLPLMENSDELILKLVDLVYLEDAQDMLLYGIYQMNVTKLSQLVKKFMLAVDEQYEKRRLTKHTKPICFELFCGGTGAWGQMERILKKLYINGYDLISDPDLQKLYKYTDRNNVECSYVSEILDEIRQKTD